MAWWLAGGLILASGTLLRIPGLPIGAGEIMLMFWLPVAAMRVGTTTGVRSSAVRLASCAFIVAASLLLALGSLQARRQGVSSPVALHSLVGLLFSWALVGVFCLQPDFDEMAATLIRAIVVIAVPLFATVFALAQVPRLTIGSYSLFYYGGVRFAAASANPNQLALYLLALPLLAATQTRAMPGRRWSWFAILVVTLVAGLATRSNALALGWVVAIAVVLGLGFIWRDEVTIRPARDVIAALIAAFLLWNLVPPLPSLTSITQAKQSHNPVIEALQTIPPNPVDSWAVQREVRDAKDAISGYDSSSIEATQTEQRVVLWKNGLSALMKSPLVGFGPGHFSGIERPFQGNEAHNTPIDWGANAGVFGVIALAAWAVTLLGSAWRNRNVIGFAGLFALLAFAQFHYVLRQPMFWFCTVLLATLNVDTFRRPSQEC